MVVSLLATGAGGTTVTMPSFTLADGVNKLGLIWPMMFTTIASLVILLRGYIAQHNLILAVTDVVMMVLAVGVVSLTIRTFWRRAPATVDS